MGFGVCRRNLRNALLSERWRKVILLLFLRSIKKTRRKSAGHLLRNQFIKSRREELLKQIETVFPAQNGANISREALTGSADVIAAHLVWSELLPFLCYWGSAFLFCILAGTLLGTPLNSLIASTLPVFFLPVPNLGIVVLAFELLLWLSWIKFLRWAEKWGSHPNTTVVLGLVIPIGCGFLLPSLVQALDWRGPEHSPSRLAVEASAAFSTILVSILIADSIASALNSLVKSKHRWLNPRAHFLKALFDALLQIIALNRDDELGWTHPEARKQLVTNLEEAARCLEVIPKTILGRDRFSNRWNQQEYLRRASGIRDRKKWVLLPKAETRNHLEQELRRILQLAAVGDWDGLPQADLPSDVHIPWWRRALTILRSLIITALPPVGVIVFGKYLPQEFKTSVTTVAWIWALISLLAMLDPRFGEKLSAFKDMPTFLPFGGKSKDR